MATQEAVKTAGSSEINSDDVVLSTIKSLIQESKKARDEFSGDWKTIENQVNSRDPEEWSKKEEWQTKLFISMQFKAFEAATAVMHQMIIGQRRWFDFIGIDSKDKQVSTDLARFFEILFEQGKFDLNNLAFFQECVKLGTSFMKLVKIPSKPEIKFSYRPLKKVLFDPAAVVDWDDARYWMEQYNGNIHEIMASDVYSDENKNKLIEHLNGKSEGKKGDHVEIFSAEGDLTYQISSEYQEVGLIEFWGFMPQKKEKEVNGKIVNFTDVELRTIVLADEQIILHNEPSDYGFINVKRGRCKRMTDHGLGYGFLKHGIGIQNLANSFVNLGFDSAKISYLPMAVYETDAPNDVGSVELKPLGKIELKPGKFGAFQITRFNTNAMGEVTQQLALLDQFHQEMTGVTREVSGVQQNFSRDETLGQTEIKLQAVERRMLQVAKELTEEFIIPLLRDVWRIVTNPKWRGEFQQLANDTVGIREIPIKNEDGTPHIDASTGQQAMVKKSKVDLTNLGKINLDFKPIGLINFTQKSEILNKLDTLIQRAESSPMLQKQVKFDKLFEQALDLADIPNKEEFIKSPEEMRKEAEAQIQMLQQAQAAQAPLPGIQVPQ